MRAELRHLDRSVGYLNYLRDAEEVYHVAVSGGELRLCLGNDLVLGGSLSAVLNRVNDLIEVAVKERKQRER